MIKKYLQYIGENSGSKSDNIDEILDILEKSDKMIYAYIDEIMNLSKETLGIDISFYIRELQKTSKMFPEKIKRELKETRELLEQDTDEKVSSFLEKLKEAYLTYHPDMSKYEEFKESIELDLTIFKDLLNIDPEFRFGFWDGDMILKYKSKRDAKYAVQIFYKNCFKIGPYGFYDKFNPEILKELGNFIDKMETDGNKAVFKFIENNCIISILVIKND